MNKITNAEKYRKELLELSAQGPIALKGGKPMNCDKVICFECDLDDLCNGPCFNNLIKWMLQPVKPTLTISEQRFAHWVETGWLARDKDGDLYHFTEEPYKDGVVWIDNTEQDTYYNISELHPNMFEFISWTDDRAWRVEDLLKLEVVEDAY